jgi:hypothetical protein
MSVDLGAEITGLKKVKVSVSRFYIESNRTEVGMWEALDFDGNPTGQSGTFVATEPIGNNGPGIVTFEITPTATFRYLVFTALANTVGGNPVSTGADNSDYLLREIVIECDDEGDPGDSPDRICIDPFDDAFPAETHVKHVGGIITEIFEPKGLEIGIVPVPRSPNNDEVGENMFNLNRSVENRLQTGLTTVAGNSRRGHLKFMGPGPSPQPIRRADAVIEGSKLTLVSNDRCASELKLYYPDIFVDGLTPIVNLSAQNQFVFQNFQNNGGTNIDVKVRVTSHTAGVEKNRTVAFTMNAAGDYLIPFASFIGVDFANVTRIVVTIDSPIESDWSLNGFCAKGGSIASARYAANRPEITEIENELLVMPTVEATMYPMPASDRLTASVDVEDHIAIPYTISDLTGRVIDRGVWYTSDDRKLDIPGRNLNNGMYLFTYTVNGATKANKFIIRK